jgi:hypothetical protein
MDEHELAVRAYALPVRSAGLCSSRDSPVLVGVDGFTEHDCSAESSSSFLRKHPIPSDGTPVHPTHIPHGLLSALQGDLAT